MINVRLPDAPFDVIGTLSVDVRPGGFYTILEKSPDRFQVTEHSVKAELLDWSDRRGEEWCVVAHKPIAFWRNVIGFVEVA